MTQPFRAYAKINLGLRIIEKRADGYHNIETVFHKIDLFDEISFSPSPTINVINTSNDAPSGDANICYKVARLLQDSLAVTEGVRISITKNIPVGAGLGGGSSDAAAVLRELPRYWKKTITEEARKELALRVGSDVPFFLGDSSALGRGRGELLEYFKLDLPSYVLLCYPNIHVSTAWAYNSVRPAYSPQSRNLRQILESDLNSPEKLVQELRNDFEPTVFAEYPEVMQVKKVMLDGGAEFASMSGSGSSVYGFFRDEKSAGVADEQLKVKAYRTFLTAPHFKP